MPYDPSGNFTRDYDWTTDRNNGVKVRADRMDGEFNNFATAMNQVVLRNGVAAFTGNVQMGGNSIVSLADGTAGTPAIRFLGSPTTGVYSPGLDKVSLTASGTNRIEANASGVVTTGTMTHTGAFNLSGALVVSGAGTFGSNVTAPGLVSTGAVSAVTLGVSGATALAALTTSGSLIANGSATFNGPTGVANTLGITGATTLGSTLGVAGATTLGSTLGVAGKTTTAGLYSSGHIFVNTGFYLGLSGDGDTRATLHSLTGADMYFRANSATRMTLNSAGNLGIGTDAGSTARVYARVGVADAAYYADNSTNSGFIVKFGSGLTSIGNDFGSPLAFLTNNTEKVRILANGNVGIGTAGPTEKLTVFGGSVYVENDVNANTDIWNRNNNTGASARAGIVVNASGNSWRMGMGSAANNSNALTWNVDVSGANTEVMRMTTGGFVGIGVSPSYRLDIQGGTAQGARFGKQVHLDDSPFVAGANISSGTNPLGIGTTGAASLSMFTNGVLRMSIDSGGLAALTGALQVGGVVSAGTNAFSTGTVDVYSTAASQTRYWVSNVETMRAIAAAAGSKIGTVTSSPFALTTNSADRLSITASGETYFNAAQSPTQSYAVGYLGLPRVGGTIKTANYTAVLADAGQHISFNGTSLTATIPATAAAAYPVGTTLTFVNFSPSPLSITINGGELLYMAGTTLTGTRTLGQNGIATAIKGDGGYWLISGPGLT